MQNSLLIVPTKRHIWVLFAVACLLHSSPVRAQQASTDQQFWLDYNASYMIDDHWSIGGDLGVRGVFTNTDWNQFIVRPGVDYRAADWFTAAAGAAWFGTINTTTKDVNEFRLYQDARFRISTLPYFMPFARLRAEQRFFSYETLENDWYLRGRILAGLQSKDVSIGTQSFFLQGILEGFWSLAGNTSAETYVDQTRIHAALGHRFASGWRYEMHYIWQAAREGSDQGLDLSIRILRLRLYHTPQFLLKDP